MQKALQEIRDHLREDIEKVDEPQLRAMFETSAEVLGGLMASSKATVIMQTSATTGRSGRANAAALG